MTPLLRILSSVCALAAVAASRARSPAARNLDMPDSWLVFAAILPAAGRGRLAQRGRDGVEQQPVVERLAQVGGGAGGETLVARLGSVVRGDHHYRRAPGH